MDFYALAWNFKAACIHFCLFKGWLLWFNSLLKLSSVFLALFAVHSFTQQLLGIDLSLVRNKKWQGSSFMQYKVNGEGWIVQNVMPTNKLMSNYAIFNWKYNLGDSCSLMYFVTVNVRQETLMKPFSLY